MDTGGAVLLHRSVRAAFGEDEQRLVQGLPSDLSELLQMVATQSVIASR